MNRSNVCIYSCFLIGGFAIKIDEDGKKDIMVNKKDQGVHAGVPIYGERVARNLDKDEEFNRFHGFIDNLHFHLCEYKHAAILYQVDMKSCDIKEGTVCHSSVCGLVTYTCMDGQVKQAQHNAGMETMVLAPGTPSQFQAKRRM